MKADPLFYSKRFCKILEDRCFEARMTQQALAERIGMDERTFRRRKRDGLWTYPQMLRMTDMVNHHNLSDTMAKPANKFDRYFLKNQQI